MQFFVLLFVKNFIFQFDLGSVGLFDGFWFVYMFELLKFFVIEEVDEVAHGLGQFRLDVFVLLHFSKVSIDMR